MDWLFLVLAGLLEMFGVMMIHRYHKRKDLFTLLYLMVGFIGSFLLLSLAMVTIPMGTAYAIWTGIGAAGGAILGIILYNESRNWKRILFISLILGSAIGLKLVS